MTATEFLTAQSLMRLIVLAPYLLLSSTVASPEELQYDQHIRTSEVVAYKHLSVAEPMKSIGILKCNSSPHETGNSYKLIMYSTNFHFKTKLRK